MGCGVDKRSVKFYEEKKYMKIPIIEKEKMGFVVCTCDEDCLYGDKLCSYLHTSLLNCSTFTSELIVYKNSKYTPIILV